MDRRTFLKMMGTAVAAPAVAKAALILPGERALILPDSKLVMPEEITKRQVQKYRFATAIHTPGDAYPCVAVLESRLINQLEFGTKYQIRAIKTSTEYWLRPLWAIMWYSKPEWQNVSEGKWLYDDYVYQIGDLEARRESKYGDYYLLAQGITGTKLNIPHML